VAEAAFDFPSAEPPSAATTLSPAARAARTIHRVEAAIAGIIPRSDEFFVNGL
jgi:hypothetical protein